MIALFAIVAAYLMCAALLGVAFAWSGFGFTLAGCAGGVVIGIAIGNAIGYERREREGR